MVTWCAGCSSGPRPAAKLAALVVLADMTEKKAKGKGAATAAPKVERAMVAYKFEDGTERIPLIEVERQLQRQYHLMAQSDDPGLRAKGESLLREAAQRAAEATLTQVQRQTASSAAQQEKKVAGVALTALAAQLVTQVPQRVTEQGKLAVARKVKSLAGAINPATDASERLARLTDRRVSQLIYGK